ncbi:4'-phosphopantetheinyl transferase family protein [Paramagnetospirillum kuznetsovii]|nr:4'-phosphopantetheinyl transferase superfamily protein [Paramagnetospirillum kuznetsovii]
MTLLYIHSVGSSEASVLVESHATPADRTRHIGAKAQQSVLGRAMVRRLIEDTTGLSGRDWIIKTDGNGRPFAVDIHGRPGPDFSISHSGPWVACAATDRGRIGIDIEVLGVDRSVQEIAATFFSPEEQDLIEIEGPTAFYDFWTIREAIGKADGGGLAAAMAVNGAALMGARHQTSRLEMDGTCWSIHHSHRHGLSIALATTVMDGTWDMADGHEAQ